MVFDSMVEKLKTYKIYTLKQYTPWHVHLLTKSKCLLIPAEKTKLKEQCETHCMTYSDVLHGINEGIMNSARELLVQSLEHSAEYYYQAILQNGWKLDTH